MKGEREGGRCEKIPRVPRSGKEQNGTCRRANYTKSARKQRGAVKSKSKNERRGILLSNKGGVTHRSADYPC